MLAKYRVLISHGKQYIDDLSKVELPNSFRGRPELSDELPAEEAREIEDEICPSGAFRANPLSIDLGRCIFCGECEIRAPKHIRFTNDFRMGTNVRENLIVKADGSEEIVFDRERTRKEIREIFSESLKLRQVSAAGDNSTEMELGATVNVNFDFVRYGIDFNASPRHSDGIVITGPISKNMAEPLDIAYRSVAHPKVLIVAGGDAISGGVFAESPALDRSFLERHEPDLYLPGNPVHPLTFIDGVRKMLGTDQESWTLRGALEKLRPKRAEKVEERDKENINSK